jgi:hypothetical protein
VKESEGAAMKFIQQTIPFCALVALSILIPHSAYAVDPKVQTTVEPVTKGPNAGCEKITIKVDPNGTIVTDVHLWLGRRIHDAAPPNTTKVTTIGDPGNYRQSDERRCESKRYRILGRLGRAATCRSSELQCSLLRNSEAGKTNNRQGKEGEKVD